jgi:hypothetical protein
MTLVTLHTYIHIYLHAYIICIHIMVPSAYICTCLECILTNKINLKYGVFDFWIMFSTCIHSFWLKHSSYVYCNGVMIIIIIIIIGISFKKSPISLPLFLPLCHNYLFYSFTLPINMDMKTQINLYINLKLFCLILCNCDDNFKYQRFGFLICAK